MSTINEKEGTMIIIPCLMVPKVEAMRHSQFLSGYNAATAHIQMPIIKSTIFGGLILDFLETLE